MKEYGLSREDYRLTMYDSRLTLGDKTFSWEYDALNRVVKETYPDDNYIQYWYDALGRRTKVRDPDGNNTIYNYNSNTLRLASIQHPHSGTTSYTYNSYGELIRIDYDNDTYVTYTYDDLGRVDTVTNHFPDGSVISSFEYTYNKDSNVTRVDIDRTGTDYYKTYSYDALHRLTQERKYNASDTLLYSYQYQYDSVGNRTQLVNYTGSQTITTTYTYNNLNQLTQRSVNAGPDQGTWTYSYDANGNLDWEKKGSSTKRDFHYNYDDRMDNVEVNYVDNYEFEYDALGRRLIYTDANGNKTLYYYDGIRVILEKTKVGAQWVTSKVYTLQDGVIGFIISEYDSESEKNRWYHYDRLGNVMDITGENGGIIASYDQDAFGNVLTGFTSGYHLTTKEHIDDIGLYYFGARWYEPQIGRFIQKDLFSEFMMRSKRLVSLYLAVARREPLLFHYYMFCRNNPCFYYDVYGLSWWNPISWPFDIWNEITNATNCAHCISSLADMKLNTPHLDELPEWKEAIAYCACLCGMSASEVINRLNDLLPSPPRM